MPSKFSNIVFEYIVENLDNNYTVGRVLMDLSKAFDCIPHDLLIAKLSAYGLNGNALKYIYTYLKNRKQCVRVNNVCSDFKDNFGDTAGFNRRTSVI